MLLERMQQDLKVAMKAGETVTVSALRFLLAQIYNRRIALEGQGASLTDEEVVWVLQKQAKDRKESIKAFKQGGREDLVKKEETELAILNQYLPAQLTAEELKKTVEEAIAQMGAIGPADFGKVMGTMMGKVKGKADGGQVAQLVKDMLTNIK